MRIILQNMQFLSGGKNTEIAIDDVTVIIVFFFQNEEILDKSSMHE